MMHPASEEEKHARTWAMLCHLSALAGCFLPYFAHLLAPLTVWLLKRNDHPLIDTHGRESLNFQISMLIYSAVGTALLFVSVIGILLIAPFLLFLYVVNIIAVVLAAIRASEGRAVRYPLTLRLLQ
jgi:uncharacterized Tic20 family protein